MGKSKTDFKCNKCKYYYHTASFGGGYNPAPYCNKFEDTGERCNPLTFECFVKREKVKNG